MWPRGWSQGHSAKHRLGHNKTGGFTPSEREALQVSEDHSGCSVENKSRRGKRKARRPARRCLQ